MIKQMAWNTFKNTGNINTFMELMELENIEKNLKNNIENNSTKVNENENIENKGNSNFRK